MTGLCRLIRGCAAQPAGPFVRRSERRKLAVLIPLFMSSREKEPSTLQPCPLHPFRGREEGAPALSPPAPFRFRARWGLPCPPSVAAGGGGGVPSFAGASIVSLWKMGAMSPRIDDTGWGDFFGRGTSADRAPTALSPLPRKGGTGGWGRTPTIPFTAGLTRSMRPRGDARLGSSARRISLDRRD